MSDQPKPVMVEPVLFWAPYTRWTVTRIPGWDTDLQVTVVVDSTAPMVINALENACARAGVRLELEAAVS